MALSGHESRVGECLLSNAKQTLMIQPSMSANYPKQTLCCRVSGVQQDQSSSMANAALRSPGFNLRNSVRAFLMSRSDPLSAAACRATVVG
jgi:hypothetical protein